MKFLRTIPKVVVLYLIADVVLVFLFLANLAVQAPLLFITQMLNLDGESNLPTWYSVIQLASVGFLALLFAYKNSRFQRPGTWALMLLPLLFFAMSLDELAQIHEQLGRLTDVLLPEGDRNQTLFQRTGIWMFILGVPAFLAIFALVFALRRYFSTVPGTMTKFILGLAIFATGSIFFETLSNIPEYGTRWYYIEVAMEEGCEMLGVTIILWAFYDLLLGHGLSVKLNSVNEEMR